MPIHGRDDSYSFQHGIRKGSVVNGQDRLLKLRLHPDGSKEGSWVLGVSPTDQNTPLPLDTGASDKEAMREAISLDEKNNPKKRQEEKNKMELARKREATRWARERRALQEKALEKRRLAEEQAHQQRWKNWEYSKKAQSYQNENPPSVVLLGALARAQSSSPLSASARSAAQDGEELSVERWITLFRSSSPDQALTKFFVAVRKRKVSRSVYEAVLTNLLISGTPSLVSMAGRILAQDDSAGTFVFLVRKEEQLKGQTVSDAVRAAALPLIQQKLESYKEFPQVISLVSLFRPDVDNFVLLQAVTTVTEAYRAYRSGWVGHSEPVGARRWVRGREVAFGQISTRDPFIVFIEPLNRLTSAVSGGEIWSAQATELSRLIAQSRSSFDQPTPSVGQASF